MTRLTPKLHSLTTLVTPNFFRFTISMNNGPIALNMAHMVKSGQLRANMPK